MEIKASWLTIFMVSLVLILSAFFIDNKFVKKPYVKEFVQVKGVVIDRFDNAYTCGGKYSSICYNRYLVIGEHNVPVALKDYTEARIGEYKVFNYTEERRNEEYNPIFHNSLLFLCAMLWSCGFGIPVAFGLMKLMED